jgi:hypothetical protein
VTIRTVQQISRKAFQFTRRNVGSLHMAFSHKARDFQLFRDVVMAMEQKRHFDPQGLVKIVESAYQMNMAGKQRRRPIGEIVERILRDYTPNPLLLEW